MFANKKLVKKGVKMKTLKNKKQIRNKYRNMIMFYLVISTLFFTISSKIICDGGYTNFIKINLCLYFVLVFGSIAIPFLDYLEKMDEF